MSITRYELLLFLHISAAIIWIGSGFLLNVLGARADRRGDTEGVRRVVDDAGSLANSLFIPAALAALIFGILLVLDGPWSFDQLWIVLGLAGFAATFVTGLFVIKPRSEKLTALIERDGMSAEALVRGRQLMVIARSDYVVLFLVVADMVLKPTTDDVGTLAVMAAILVAGVAYVVVKARSVGTQEQAA